jgi:ribosomal protein S18 acetylase RimI-like enzyme
MRVSVLMDGLPDEVVQHLVSLWGSTFVASRGRLHGLRELPALAVRGRGRLLGLAFYKIEDGECELVALDAMTPGAGSGTALLEAVAGRARADGCSRLWLVTTNDNMHAMGFYQRHGMRLVAAYPGAVDEARARVKPEIPAIGIDGIPIHDEIEFELRLT